MKTLPARTSRYFYAVACAVAGIVILLILIDAYKFRQVRDSFAAYMNNLRDVVFMSTYDSLENGNMQLFKLHLEEIATFNDVEEFSLLDAKGIVRYSSAAELIAQVDTRVTGRDRPFDIIENGFTTYYLPVATTVHCSRCHAAWPVGSINSYYKLTLSRRALEALELGSLYHHGFKIVGGGVLLAFFYLLFSLYERRKHEEQMLLSASVFENAIEAIAITSVDGIIEKINPAFTQITGFSAAEILGLDIHLISAGEINRATYEQMRVELMGKGTWSGELWNRKKSGESFPVRLSVTAVSNAQNRITHFISIFYDITESKANHDQLEHQVYHDALTGLPNRRLFDDRLQMALSLASRNRHQVAVLFIDLDNFKTVNDSSGHHTGDLILVETARRLRQCCREVDTIARFGGDEFVIILPELQDPEDVCSFVERLQGEVALPLDLEGRTFAISPSIGVAIYPRDGRDVQTLLVHADAAMYQAKTQGKNPGLHCSPEASFPCPEGGGEKLDSISSADRSVPGSFA